MTGIKLKTVDDFMAEGLDEEAASDAEMDSRSHLRNAEEQERPNDVLDAVGGLLRKHGLEIVLYDGGGDELIWFSVEKL